MIYVGKKNSVTKVAIVARGYVTRMCTDQYSFKFSDLKRFDKDTKTKMIDWGYTGVAPKELAQWQS